MSQPSPWIVQIFRLLPILAVLLGLTTLAWWWSGRLQAQDVSMPGAHFNSLSFAPFRAGQSPLTGVFPTAAEVEADMALIAGRTRGIRTYAALGGDYDVAALAERHGLKLWLGIWLGTDRAGNEKEIARAIEIAHAHPATVERIIVGNEVLLRRDLPVEELIAAIDRVRPAVSQPVTYADVWEFWKQFPQVAAHVDVVTIHLLPYWEDEPTGIAGAVAHVDAVYHEMAALFPGKKIAIGETGWPSDGRARADAVPSHVNQAVFIRRFVTIAQREGFDYNLIEAFDQTWKARNEGAVGGAWGLWTADRAPKFSPNGPVSNNPLWPRDAALTAVASLMLLASALAGRPNMRGAAQARLAVLAVALGGALVFGWARTIPAVFDWHQRFSAWVNLSGQGALAVMMMARAADRLMGRAAGPARSGAQATGTIRHLLLLRPELRRIGTREAFEDLLFVFLWTAAVLQLLLVFDPRYRDFPLPSFAVPLVCVAARGWLRDLPRGGGGQEEWTLACVLVCGAVASAVQEGPANHQSLLWNAGALILAAPLLLRLIRQGARAEAVARQ